MLFEVGVRPALNSAKAGLFAHVIDLRMFAELNLFKRDYSVSHHDQGGLYAHIFIHQGPSFAPDLILYILGSVTGP